MLLTPLNETDSITAAIGCFATAFFSLIMGKKWNESLDEYSSLFWIRMEYWFWILTTIGILIVTGVLG
ncbi:MAG: hypothetical protein KDC90_06940 [Ignavibacteriae bacterium]|nr:hypothetical protein [Ignavibacteriota bacterium]